MPAWPRAGITVLALVLAACAEGPPAPGAADGAAAGASAAHWRGRVGECANVGDVLQKRKCLDTVERDRERARPQNR